MCVCIYADIPHTEEIRIKIFASQDSPVIPAFFCSDRDSVYSRENLFKIVGAPEKTCLICTGTPVWVLLSKLARKFAVVIILSPISFVRGMYLFKHIYMKICIYFCI